MKTVCFGELMLRLNPPSYDRFLQTDSFEATFGGGEANVSVSIILKRALPREAPK